MANRLIGEQSPYLLQHAHNPVDWYPWSDEPFERAKKENKPVIVSIGYAACHWCHVMERESFENEQVAAYMNEYFVCIKVDREEHPDVDQLYMDAVQAISGSGGWPLNVFVTPDRIPFYGGTYYPPVPAYNRPSWLQLLSRMHEIWTKEYKKVAAQSDQMLQFLKQSAAIASVVQPPSINKESIEIMVQNLLKQADRQYGGFGSAPKFPGTMAISFLLEHYHFTGHEESLRHALLSLDCMVKGGIYDRLGGGFARYSTDAKWLVPHFEKMLYDNALIVLSLCDAYQITKSDRYRKTIKETLDFVERELKDESGLYYSALDADSEGVEGKSYTWTWEEWSEVVDDPLVTEYFGVTEKGNWEHTNILHEAVSLAELSNRHNCSEEEAVIRIKEAEELLFEVRSGRIRPLTDDKSLLSWNALMNLALSKAAVALEEDAYLHRAEKHMGSMLQHFYTESRLCHVWKQGSARIDANLDDYAYLIQALLQLGSATGHLRWIKEAAELTATVMQNFRQDEGHFFYFTSSVRKDIPVRKIESYDGATPSANAVMAHNLLLLGMVMENTRWLRQSQFMINQISEAAIRYPSSFGYWATLVQRLFIMPRIVVTTGPNAYAFHKHLQDKFLPHCFLLTSGKEISDLPVLNEKEFSGESLIFVCTQEACLAPVGSVEESLHLISAY